MLSCFAVNTHRRIRYPHHTVIDRCCYRCCCCFGSSLQLPPLLTSGPNMLHR